MLHSFHILPHELSLRTHPILNYNNFRKFWWRLERHELGKHHEAMQIAVPREHILAELYYLLAKLDTELDQRKHTANVSMREWQIKVNR